MKKLSGIRYGQKKQRGKSDEALLIKIQNYLRKRWHLNFKREWYIGFDKESNKLCCILEQVSKDISDSYKWKNPDLLYIHKNLGLLVIEVDGSVHDRKIDKTLQRNRLYEKNGLKLSVISLSQLKHSGKTIEEEIDWKMMKLGL